LLGGNRGGRGCVSPVIDQQVLDLALRIRAEGQREIRQLVGGAAGDHLLAQLCAGIEIGDVGI
jgi:hypothetical protein